MLAVLMICLFPAMLTAQFYRLNVYIYNDGTIPVNVVEATLQGLLHNVKISGRYTIAPGDHISFFGYTTSEYLFAFEIKNAAGKRGFVAYGPERERNGHSRSNVRYAVPREGTISVDASRNDLSFPGADEIMAPFSWQVGIDSYDGYEKDRDFFLHVNPSSDDAIATFIDEEAPPKKLDFSGIRPLSKPASPSTTTAPDKISTPSLKGPSVNQFLLSAKCYEYRPKSFHISFDKEKEWCSCIVSQIMRGKTGLTENEKIKIQQEGFSFFESDKRYQAIRDAIFNTCLIQLK
jgi:hypothetical protein